MVGVAFWGVEIKDVIGFICIGIDCSAAGLDLVLEGFADWFGFVCGDLIESGGVSGANSNSGFPVCFIGDGAADETVGDLVDSHADLGSILEFEAGDFLVEGSDLAGVWPGLNGVVLSEGDVTERTMVCHADEFGLNVDVAGADLVVSGEFFFGDIGSVGIGFALGFGVVVDVRAFSVNCPVIEVLSPGSVFGDGGGGNSGEGAEDVERGFEASFSNFPEISEAIFGKGFR